MDATPSPAMGHNSSGLDLSLALDPEQLLRDLNADAAPLFTRRDELLAAFARFDTATPDGIPNAEVQAKAGDFVRQLAAHIATADARRTTIKKPVLDAQRAIDGFFKSNLTDPLDEKKRAVLAKVTEFLKRQEDEERDRRRAEAERQRVEAERLAAEAERTQSAAAMDRAMQAEETAAALVAAPRRRPAITRSDLGTSVSSRKGPWKLRVIDIDKVPRMYLVPNETVLLAVAKSSPAVADGQQPIAGIEFYRETIANIR